MHRLEVQLDVAVTRDDPERLHNILVGHQPDGNNFLASSRAIRLLGHAVENRSIRVINYLTSSGVNASATDTSDKNYGFPLFQAVKKNDPELVEALIREGFEKARGAPPDRDLLTLTSRYASGRTVDVVLSRLDNPQKRSDWDEIIRSRLVRAYEKGNADFVDGVMRRNAFVGNDPDRAKRIFLESFSERSDPAAVAAGDRWLPDDSEARVEPLVKAIFSTRRP